MEKEKMTKLEKQWVLYDVGNSAFVMLVSTIIPIYFKNMATASGISAANSTAYLSYAILISTILAGICHHGNLVNRSYPSSAFEL